MTAEGAPASRPALLILAYLPLLGLIPLFASRDALVRWHARNGTALFLAVAAAGLLATIVSVLAPSLTCLYAAAMGLVGMLYVFIALLAAVKALSGERLVIPLVSRYAQRFAAR